MYLNRRNYFIILNVFLGLKRYNFLACIGFILCIVGEGLRKTAMITGSTNFAHIVQTEKDDKHVLVTHGIYSLFRHPSYVGWFYWSIGTQVNKIIHHYYFPYTFVNIILLKKKNLRHFQVYLSFKGFTFESDLHDCIYDCKLEIFQ